MKSIGRALLALVIVAAAITAWSYTQNGAGQNGAGDGQQAGHAAQAAIVPDADLIIRVNLEAAKAAPITKHIKAAQDDALQPEDAKARYEQFRALTGLSEDDVRAVVFSADTDRLAFEQGMTPEQFSRLNAVAAIDFAKPVDLDKLAAGVKLLLNEEPNEEPSASLAKMQLHDTDVLVITDQGASVSKVYLAMSSDPQTLFLTFNEASLGAAFQRQRQGNTATVPETLQAVVSGDAQTSFAFVAPESMRQAIQAQLKAAQNDPQAAMTSGFITPFKDLRSVAVSLRLDTDMRFDIACDLGQAPAATQVAAMLQGMVIPMLSSMMAQSSGQPPTTLSEKIQVSVEGSILRIALRFTDQDVDAYRKRTASLKQQPRSSKQTW